MAEKLTAAPWEIPYPTSAGEVKLGATDMEEMAERVTTIFKEKVLVPKARAASYEAASGELGIQSSAGATTTLPAATTGRIIGLACTASSCKVTTSGGAEIWAGAVKAATLTLTKGMSGVLYAEGTNWVYRGEYKNEAAFGAQVERAWESENEPSASRETEVILEVFASGEKTDTAIEVGGVVITTIETTVTCRVPFSFRCPAGVKWKPHKISIGGSHTFSSSYRTL